MNDITKCKGEEKDFIYPLRDNCYRFTAKSDYWQSWFAEVPYDKKKKKCKYYWNVNKKRYYDMAIESYSIVEAILKKAKTKKIKNKEEK